MPIVTFSKLNIKITLRYNEFHNVYYLSYGSRGNKISESLANYIMTTYKTEQLATDKISK